MTSPYRCSTRPAIRTRGLSQGILAVEPRAWSPCAGPWSSESCRVRPRVIDRRAILMALSLIATLVVVFHVFPLLYVMPSDVPNRVERLKAQNDVRTAAIQAVGGLIALIGALAAVRQYALQQYSELENRVNEKLQQLGSEVPELRLSAIEALGQLAAESPRRAPLIREVLASWVARVARVGSGAHTRLLTRCSRLGEDGRRHVRFTSMKEFQVAHRPGTSPVFRKAPDNRHEEGNERVLHRRSSESRWP
jgi:muconolactone delta-isomerase